jgi:hypothetical protein
MCKAARNCACKTYWDDEWKKRLSDEGFLGHNWLSIWACVAKYCREGGLKINCKDLPPGELGGSNTGVGEIEIDPGALQSIGNTLLHELLHVCGILGGPGEKYPEDYQPFDPFNNNASAPSWIANRCLTFGHNSYNYLNGGSISNPPEDIIQPDPKYPFDPDLY